MSDKGRKNNKKKRLTTDSFGGNNKKSKLSTTANNNSNNINNNNNNNKTVFLVCPGAGGVLPKDGTLEAQLGRLGRVAVIPKSTGYDGKKGCCCAADRGASNNNNKKKKKGAAEYHLNQNLQILNDFIAREVIVEEESDIAATATATATAAAATTTTTEWVLVGQSFGCRAILHWLCGNHEIRKHPSIPVPWSKEVVPNNYHQLRPKIRKVLFFGYPLAHATQDRSAALKLLPDNIRACFVIGTSDKMALGNKLDQKAIKETLKKASCHLATTTTTNLIWVEKGGHSPPNEKKWNEMNLNAKIHTFLTEETE